MTLTSLLGKKLKDEEILQLIEDYQVGDVVYDFDRLREGTEDEYWAEAKVAGFAVRFDQNQVLKTVFCYASSIEGFTPISASDVGVPFFSSFEDAAGAAKAAGVRHSTGHVDDALLGLKLSWVRHERPEAWVHYEFRDGELALVTLSRPRP
ncbi:MULTISPECIES: hypothetical protein [Variovorax]|jgi:hypothetical protein|uniref:hypothetical protein n=1 Tax=Variovorax TaxID=34072 RepID=UPI00086B3F72|nr:MULTISPECIES: hypothetical protein [Variovorax]MBN8753794.1 hypothetical protein [Variovorax sp.]ODU17203.1 MAG: hypothetical protein ABS94_09230 [Variovorax sp. SCN 67-85]ODV17845.1 MAG: hypothetical protein ABT25_28955 [Variovorax sp. SCN 67-20]OJZ02580.1 MAG: hypothetical protein BGP22_19335 [Variovorax sp. 67-131]UKI10956.1 hypothetical protein L3V85_14255 [Variovorax paradoxus]